jgi:hypothetical protein
MKESRFDCRKLGNTFGLGIDLTRDDYCEYRWWECEIHITLGAYYLTFVLRKYV